MLRRKTALAREGRFYLLLLAAVFGAAMAKGINLLLILGGMLLGPIVLNWLLVGRNLRGLRFARKLPAMLCAGDTLSVRLHLTNPRKRLGCWDVAVEEQVQRVGNDGPPRQPVQTSLFFPYVPPGRLCTASYHGRLAARGRYQLGPLRASTQFPFGLLSRTIVVNDTETLTVLPRLGRLTRDWEARRYDAFAGADRRNRSPGPEGDFYGVREWHDGDGRRLIHWRSSARLDKLVVRQFEQPHNRDVALVLDLWQSEQPDEEQQDNVELAVSFAATVLTDLCRKGGSNVLLALTDGEPECLGGPTSSALLQRLLERLATIEARCDDALPRLLEHAMRRISAGVEIVLISTRAVDLADGARFALAGFDPPLYDRLRRIRCIDTSSEDLTKYFLAE